MTGADTNMIVRFLVRDNEKQARKVKEVLTTGETLYINQIVLSELYWVLMSVYGYSKNDIVLAIDTLLETQGFHLFDSTIVKQALADFIHSSADFPDCLIHRINSKQGLRTATFDRKASSLKKMYLLK